MNLEIISTAFRIGLTGLVITFVALLVLRLIIGMLARMAAGPASVQKSATPPPSTGGNETDSTRTSADEDIAAIMAALSAMGVLPKSGGRIHIEEISG